MGPDLVGRSGELAVLADAARGVAGGTGTCVHVVGEAGIGKSSLLAAVAEELGRHGVSTRSATVHETDHRRPLRLVESLLSEAEAASVAAGEPGGWATGDAAGRAVGVVEELATAGPVALLADDLHWADDASLEVLCAVARRTEALGVLLVTAARPQPVSHMLRRYEATLPAHGHRLAPRPLGAADLASLVEQRTGAAPGPALTALLAGAAGNPFLAVELVGSLLDDHRLAPRDGVVDLTDPVPATPAPALPILSDELVGRLARRALVAVPGGELVLRAVATVPGGLTVDELAALLDQPLGELVAATLAAVDAAVLVDSGATLTFRHDLLRQAVLGATPPSIVGALRRRAATVLLDLHAPAERLAACLLADDRVDRVERPDPAETDRLLAVGRSLKKRNPDAAADLLRRALDGIGPDDARSLPTTIELGWALAAAGRAREVGPLIQERAGRADADGPVPVELVRLESVALSLAGRLGEASACYDDLDLSRLVDDLDATDPEVVDAAAELAFLRTTSGRLEEAARLVDWVDGSPTPDSAFRRASSSTVRAWLAGTAGAFEDAAERARAALRAVDQDDSLAVTPGSPMLALGLVLDGQGDGDAALAVFRGRGRGLGRGHESLRSPPRWAPPLLQFGAALVLFRQGEWDDALAEAEAGLLAAEETGLGLGAFWPCSIGTLVNCARSELAEARRWLDRSWAITPHHELGIEWLLYATAALREAEGRTDEAGTILDLMARGVLDAGAPALLLNGGADMVRLALATGRDDSADLVAAELDAMTHRTASPVVAAMARWARGLVDAHSPGAGGWRDIERAAATLAGCRRVPEAARAHHDAAVRAAQAGEPAEARRLAASAFAVYDRLDAQQLHRRLRAELRAHDLVLRPRRRPRRPQRGWESLTASESTIVDLVGQGLTNTQIAERLYVSRRTVESHLGRVYAKLDLSTRAQLVAATARADPQATD